MTSAPSRAAGRNSTAVRVRAWRHSNRPKVGIRKLHIRLHRGLRTDSSHAEVCPLLHELDYEVGINHEPAVCIGSNSASVRPRIGRIVNRVQINVLVRFPAGAT